MRIGAHLLCGCCLSIASAASTCAKESSCATEIDAATLLQGTIKYHELDPDAALDEEASIDDSPLNVRPGLHLGKTDVVEFGILMKKWYGIKENTGEASADVVMVLRWRDPRVSKIIPGKATSLRISGERAEEQIWMPRMAVTNIAHGGFDIISSSVKISSDGTVTQLDRVLLTVQQTIETENFPFDSQTVLIKVASRTYMRDEVSLKPVANNSEWGVPKGRDIFENSVWYFLEDHLMTENDQDGVLDKSRGVLTVQVKRCISQFATSVFMPSVVFLFMTWSAFWLPLGGPYAMPRIALNAFALLCQVSVSQMADRKIPETGRRTWMNDYLALCIQLQFALALLNVIIITIENKKDGHHLADHLNDRMILSYPISTTANILILETGHTAASRVCLAATMACYIAYLSLSYKWHHEEKEAARGAATPRSTDIGSSRSHSKDSSRDHSSATPRMDKGSSSTTDMFAVKGDEKLGDASSRPRVPPVIIRR